MTVAITLMTEEEVASFGREEDAGFGALSTERGLLPLTAMDVSAQVAGVIASIDVAQTFVNTTRTPLEATYIFPLPDRAAVHRFRMEVAGRVIEGVIDERAAAREQYEEAIAAGHRAAITEEERPGVFTLRVGNLMPGEAATVRLSLVGPLPVDDGEVTFRFPLVVAPRYIPGATLGGDQAGLGVAEDTSLVPDASRISPPVRLPGCPNPVRLGVRVWLADRGVTDVAASLSTVTTEVLRGGGQIFELTPGERLDRDFILRWRLDARELRSSLVCADDADGKAGTFMLTLVPPSTAAVAAKPRDVVFVIDRSGSMQGWKMVAARRATARIIDTLTSRDRFCVLAFDNTIEALPAAELADATDRRRFRAVEALAKIDARGGTELAEPLREALRLLAGGHDDRTRVIVLVTDGQVGNEDHILRELAPNLHGVRVFTLGIDQAVNAAFLRRLAGAGGGLCELVESEDRLDAVMAKVHRRIGMPIATDLAIRAVNLELDAATLAPKKLPDVYAGAPVTVFGRYRGTAPATAALELDATSLGDAFHVAVPRATTAAEGASIGPSLRERHGAGSWLAASWARAHVRELEDRYATGARELEPEIVATSKRFGVLSRFTAFLAVDRSEVVNKGGKLQQIVQPVEPAAGWDMLERGAAAGGRRAPAPMAMAPMAMPAGPMMAPPAMPPGAPPPIQAQAAMPRGEAKAKTVAAPAPRRGTAYLSPMPPLEQERSIGREPASEAPSAAHLAELGELARELDAQARGSCDVARLRLVRQRLTEWVEDVRSVGAGGELADAVEHLVQRLSAALALASSVASEVLAVASELAKLAAGAPPPPSKGRVAFWK